MPTEHKPLVAHFVVQTDSGRRVLIARVQSVDVAREIAALRTNRVLELSVWQGPLCLWKD